MIGFNRKEDFLLLQNAYNFKALYAFWNNYRVQYAKRIQNDIFAFLILQNTKYDSNIGFINLYIARIQQPTDVINKDPTMFNIDISITGNIDFNKQYIEKLTKFGEEKIISLLPSLSHIANAVNVMNDKFDFPNLGRYKFLKNEYETYKIFFNNKCMFEDVFELVFRAIEKKKSLNEAKKQLKLHIEELKQLLPDECCGYNFFVDDFSKASLIDYLIDYLYLDLSCDNG